MFRAKKRNWAVLSQGCTLPGYDAMIYFRPAGINIREEFEQLTQRWRLTRAYENTQRT